MLIARKIVGGLACCISAPLILIAFWAYSVRPDGLAAATFLPAWVWTIVGFGLGIAGLMQQRRFGILLMFGWMVFVAIFIEEFHSGGRWLVSSSSLEDRLKNRGGSLVVVSMNCVGGMNAVHDLERFQPDIILLQERPGDEEQLREFATGLYGESAVVALGADTAVIAKGTPISTGTSDRVQRYLAHATFRTGSGRDLSVYSIRLQPPQIDTHLFSPDCWAAHRNDRVARRAQLQRAVEEYQSLPADRALLFGGDFNVAAHDGALSPLRPRLHDAFRLAGHGIGNSATNALPLFRIDQLWHSRSLKPHFVTAVPSKHSDHRIVIAVFVVE